MLWILNPGLLKQGDYMWIPTFIFLTPLLKALTLMNQVKGRVGNYDLLFPNVFPDVLFPNFIFLIKISWI